MRNRTLACLVIAVLIAGCWTGPFAASQDEPIYVKMTNHANTSRTIELWYAEDPLVGIRNHRSSGGDYTWYTTDAGISSSDPGDYHTIASVEFPEAATLYGRYTLAPNESHDWRMDEPYVDTVYVMVVYDDDHVTATITVNCDVGLTAFGATATSYGAAGGYNC